MKIIINYNKDKDINRITDYFTEECRIKCSFKNTSKTPLEYYKYNKGILIKNSIVNKKFNINKFEDVMFNQKDIKFCNNFQSSIALTIYKIFNAKNIFDSSAGWGDRLIAAIAHGCNYTGVDPSECLKPLYNNIIDKLYTNNPNKLNKSNKTYKIINKGIENVKMKKNNYDLCFSSPPFLI